MASTGSQLRIFRWIKSRRPDFQEDRVPGSMRSASRTATASSSWDEAGQGPWPREASR